MSTKLFLGIVDLIRRASDRGAYANLLPFGETSQDGARWQREFNEDDRKRNFPNTGHVTWFTAAVDVLYGSVWKFETEEQPSYKADIPTHDEFKVLGTPTPVTELIQLRSQGDIEWARKLLLYDGLPLNFTPCANSYLVLSDGLVLGPLTFIRNDDSQRWFLDPQKRNTPMNIYSMPGMQQYKRFNVESTVRSFLHPTARVDELKQQVDWSPPDILLKRVFKVAKNVNPKLVTELKLTNQMINQIAHLLEQTPQGTKDLQLDRQRLSDAKNLVSNLLENMELSNELIDELRSLPKLSEMLNQKHALAQKSVNAEVTDELSRLRDESQKLSSEIDQLNQQKQLIQEEIAQAVLVAKETTPETGLSKTVDSASQPTDDVNLNDAVGTPDFSTETAPSANGKYSIETSLKRMRSALNWTPNRLQLVKDESDFLKRLRAALKRAGFKPTLAIPLHAAFLSGISPVLCGSDYALVIRAYASCAVASRVITLPITPMILEPANLFGHVDPDKHIFIPGPGGLVDVLLTAREDDATYLVCLDRANSTALEPSIGPILEAYTRRTSTAIPLFHPKSVSIEDPYAEAAWLNWPSNVLLAMTFQDGPSCLPPTRDFWSNASLIQLDLYRAENQSEPSGSEPDDPTEVSYNEWAIWQTQRAQDEPGLSEIIQLLNDRGILIPKTIGILADVFYSLIAKRKDHTTALCATVFHILAPVLPPIDDRFLVEMNKIINCDSEKLRIAFDQVRRVMD